ncbi:MAG: hypothetical protein QM736_03445 [Vicinamibacterales bacterium]
MDSCVRTREGRLVNLDAVAAALRELPGVRDVVVLPIAGGAGPTFGALLECHAVVDPEELRRAIGASLPPWALPRIFHAVPALPRLPNRKPDRLACLRLLAGEVAPT